MLKKEIKEWLDIFNNITVPNLIANGFKPNAINAREGLANITKSLISDIPVVAQIQDDIIETFSYNVPVRIYNPNPNKKLPVIVYLHGGGHMAGSVTVYDPICRKLANITEHIVVSVEYRLSPENPYPLGIIDCYNAIKNVWNVLNSRSMNYLKELSIVGDSGGGAIATTVAMKAQFDDNINIKRQVLIYPSVDYTMSFPSIEINGTGYLLAKSKISWYFDNYFQKGEDRKNASPLFGEFTSKLPKTLIFTAEYCPLRDEGFEYAKRLKDIDIYVEHYNLENMIHTFMNMEDLCKDECNFVYNKIKNFLKE